MKFLATILLIFACSIGTMADTLIKFNVTGGIQAQGVIDVSSIPFDTGVESCMPFNDFPILGISGEIGGQQITDILNPGQVEHCMGAYWSFAEFDVSSNSDGIQFTAGGDTWNLSRSDLREPEGFLDFLDNETTGFQANPIEVVYTQVPEPGTLLLLSAGIAMMGALRKRSRCWE